MDIEARLDEIERRYDALSEEMASPEVVSDPDLLRRKARELAQIEELAALARDLRRLTADLANADEVLRQGAGDPELVDLVELARAEREATEARRERLLDQARELLMPRDPNEQRDCIVEIRAGTGGEEAALFAADLFRMYSRYAERHRWEIEVLDHHDTEMGGLKEVVFEVHGKGAYSRLRYESGVHRVQRVPATEAQGRIHTSTATVAVLPVVEDVEVEINEKDLRVDIFHSGGAGGQNVNKVATAVRLTHLPTGIVVTCQDERSQLKNREKAMAVLRARLYDLEQRKQTEAIESQRRAQVGAAERAEKIRTYNFPQDRLTDHRIGVTVHRLPAILDGEIDGLIDQLRLADRDGRLARGDAA